MIEVKIIYYTPFSGLTKKRNEEIAFDNEVNLENVLRYLSDSYGDTLGKYLFNENNKYNPKCLILVNQTYTDKLDTVIKDGDEISLVPPVAGG